MSTLVIVGAQWGDEAKGKLVDVLSEQADMVVRFSGGNNAGHTVIVGTQTFKFQLLPAGILHERVTAVVGSGMVVCPKSLLEELDRTRAAKPQLGNLKISSSCHVVFPYHLLLDRLEEEARGENKIGTTSRGIGPAYQDKVARIGIRMGEFVKPQIFRKRLFEVLSYKNRLLQMFGEKPLDFESLHEEYAAYAEKIRPFVCDTDDLIQQAVADGRKVLFEGAQGALLDLDAGTYPYVTSSHPVAGGACLGTGIGPLSINSVLGVCKAYSTRVGSGPFPTELHDAVGEAIRQKGNEFGTVTGRARRCGWLDLVSLRTSCRVNSLSGLVVTRLDVLSGQPFVRMATGYKLDGKPIHYVPAETDVYAEVCPEYDEMPGWDETLKGVHKIEDLPAACRNYLEFIEEFVGVKVAILSIGPERDETIVVRPELIWR
jgi:adenylosuccinate synthase